MRAAIIGNTFRQLYTQEAPGIAAIDLEFPAESRALD
jgi:hypothetical protein